MRKDQGRRLGFAAVVLGLAAVFSGCNQTKISEINKHPETFAGYEVTIAGRVTHSGGDFSSGSFEVDDGSGKLWVISDSLQLPSEGSQIAVTGMVVDKTDLGS